MRFFGCKYLYCPHSLATFTEQKTLDKIQTIIEAIDDFCEHTNTFNSDLKAALQQFEYEQKDDMTEDDDEDDNVDEKRDEG